MLCVSVSEKSAAGCLRVLNALKETEMAEIRVDLICQDGLGEVSAEELNEIWSHPRKKIATCRDLKEKGFTEQRRMVLENAMALGTVQMVDLEYEAPEAYRVAVVQCAKKNNVEVIVSYHNYEETPKDTELAEIVENCFKFGADIAKVAVKANSKADSARVLALYNDSRQIVSLGMGEHGKITRVAALSLGAPFTFVAESEKTATAPGQLTLDQMRRIEGIMSESHST